MCRMALDETRADQGSGDGEVNGRQALASIRTPFESLLSNALL